MMLDLEPVRGVVAVREQPVDHPGEGRRRATSSLDMRGRRRTWRSMQADARKVKQIVYNLLSNAVKFTRRRRRGDAARQPRPARRRRQAVRRLAGAQLPAGRQRVRRVSRDQRHRQRHRHLAGGPGAAVQAVQPDRQRPGAKVRGHGSRPGDGEAARRAARRRRGRGERGRRRARASRSGCRCGRRRRSARAGRRPRCRAALERARRACAPRWSSRTTSSPRS